MVDSPSRLSERLDRHRRGRRVGPRPARAGLFQRVRPVDVLALAAADRAVALEHLAVVLEAEHRAPCRASERVRQHPRRRSATRTSGSWRKTAGMWRTFIQRSAFQRMNSTSSGSRCAPRVTAVVPSYSSTSRVHDQAALLEVACHRRAGVRRRMLDVRPVDVPPGKLEVRRHRFAPSRRGCRRSVRRRPASRDGAES